MLHSTQPVMTSINEAADLGERQPLLLGHQQRDLDLEDNSPTDSTTDKLEIVPNVARVFSFQDIRMNIAAGMMDLSLFIANTNQLANVIRTPKGVELTVLEKVTTVLICMSIILQVFVVLLLIWRPPDPTTTIRTNRGTVTCIFLILVINVFVACLNNEQQHFTCPSNKVLPAIGA